MGENLKSGTIFEKGSWQAAINEAGKLFDKAGESRKKAGAMLWKGATSAIALWEETGDDADVLYNEILGILGEARKGDASKIATVARASKTKGLDTGQFNNLSRAYAEAVRLTKTERQNVEEDSAADEATEAIKASAPKSTSKPEGAAQIVLAQGVDEAARLLLSALPNDDSRRALIRAFADEFAGMQKQAKAEADAVRKAEAEAKREAAKAEREKVAAEKKAEREKVAAEKAAASKAAAKTKGKPAPKGRPAKAEPVEENMEEPVEDDSDDLFDMVDEDESSEVEFTEEQAAASEALKTKAAKKGVPVARKGRPVR
jgi:hypothetical protein